MFPYDVTFNLAMRTSHEIVIDVKYQDWRGYEVLQEKDETCSIIYMTFASVK